MMMMTKPCIIRFMGSLTALLVLASMMPVFTGDLPKASYTKVLHDVDGDFVLVFDDVGAQTCFLDDNDSSFQLIDMWLLFFIISTTINICIHIIVDWLRKEELEKKRQSESTQVRPMTVTVSPSW